MAFEEIDQGKTMRERMLEEELVRERVSTDPVDALIVLGIG